MIKVASVTIDVSNLKSIVKKVKHAKGLVERGWRDVAQVYRAFVLRRYRKFSAGGGDWPPLSPFTVAAKGSSAILIDTGLLIGSLNPGLSGKSGFYERIRSNRSGVRVGFGFGDAIHTPSGMTMTDLATIHQLGLGVPKREILVPPDDKTRKQMAKALEARIRHMIKAQNT